MFKRLAFLTLFCLFFQLVFFIPAAKAQPCVAGDIRPECDTEGTNPDAPLDTGVILLLLAGTVYGLKKIRDHQRGLKILQAAE